MTDLREKVKRLVIIEDGILEPSSEFEKICLNFTHYLIKENRGLCFMWDNEWLRENFEKIKKITESETWKEKRI